MRILRRLLLMEITRRTRTILAIILINFLVVGSGSAFAVWQGQNDNPDSQIIDLGTGTLLLVQQPIRPEPHLRLVPYSAFRGENDVDEIRFSYLVLLNKKGTIYISTQDIIIGDHRDIDGLIAVDIFENEPHNIAKNNHFIELTNEHFTGLLYSVTVTVTVRIIGPLTQAQVDQLMRQSITVTLQFSADVANHDEGDLIDE